MGKESHYLEALREKFNVVGLATAAAVSAATLNPLPLLAGIVAETVYLLFVPDSKWYDARLSRRYDAEVERRREKLKTEVLPTLQPDMQARFTHLEEVRRQINAQPTEDQKWFREVVRKLDYLLEKMLLFASKELQFRRYLNSLLQEARGATASPADAALKSRATGDSRRLRPVSPQPSRPSPVPSREDNLRLDPSDQWVQRTVSEVQAFYDQEMNGLKDLLQNESDPDTKAVLEKRLSVLDRRHEFVDKIGKVLTNLHHQLALIEDTFGLISDEIRARSPEQILADVEEVVGQTDTMTKVLEELVPYENIVSRLTA